MCVWSALTSSTRTLAVAFLQHRDVHYLRLCQPQSVPHGTSPHTILPE